MNERSAIRDLSDKELSRWIAEKLEPEPERGLPYWKRCEIPCSACDGTGANADRTASCRRCQGYGKVYSRCPRDMVNDAAMTVMLLERGLGSLDWVSDGDFKMWRGGFERQDHSRIEYVTAKTLGRAVAEAFALANGFDGEAQ